MENPKKRKGHGAPSNKSTDWIKLLEDIQSDGFNRIQLQEFIECIKKENEDLSPPPSGLNIAQCCLLYIRWLQSNKSLREMDKIYNQAASTLVLILGWVSKRLNGFIEKWLSKMNSKSRLEWALDDDEMGVLFSRITAILGGFHSPVDYFPDIDADKRNWKSNELKRTGVTQLAMIARNGWWMWLSDSYPASQLLENEIIQNHRQEIWYSNDEEYCTINKKFDHSNQFDSDFLIHSNPTSSEDDLKLLLYFQVSVFENHLLELKSRWNFINNPFRGADFSLYHKHLQSVFALENVRRFGSVVLALEKTTFNLDQELNNQEISIENFDPQHPFNNSSRVPENNSIFRHAIERTLLIEHNNNKKRKIIVDDDE